MLAKAEQYALRPQSSRVTRARKPALRLPKEAEGFDAAPKNAGGVFPTSVSFHDVNAPVPRRYHRVAGVSYHRNLLGDAVDNGQAQQLFTVLHKSELANIPSFVGSFSVTDQPGRKLKRDYLGKYSKMSAGYSVIL